MTTQTARPALVVMAAGMGSRFGGLKQLTPVGKSGEMILDYSVYDALRAGFDKVIFVIKREIEEAFRGAVGDRMSKYIKVEYAFQEINSELPAGYTLPADRVKPWGTGHAVLCGMACTDGPFMAINADDFYGKECYRLLHDFLAAPSNDKKIHIAMAGFELDNTLTENGYVSRGVCTVDGGDMLCGIEERVRIERRDGGAAFSEDDGATWTPLAVDSCVSMNCWAFPAGMRPHFERLFHTFLANPDVGAKSEFYLPYVVDCLIRDGKADVSVLRTSDRWYGMTYAGDRERVEEAIGEMIKNNDYPAALYQGK